MIRMIATASAVAFVVLSCKGKLGEADAINIEEAPVQTVDDMFIVQSKNGIIQMRAEAPVMERYERDTMSFELFPSGFFVYGYTDDEKLETEIVADRARHLKYKDGRETWEAFGNVVVKNLINQFKVYYPQTAEAFMYDITDGQSYTVSCGGMRATTTVRTQK